MSHTNFDQLASQLGDRFTTDAAVVVPLSADASTRNRKLVANDWERPLAQAAVLATSTEDVVTTLTWANDNNVPVVTRGLGSGVTGSGVPVEGGIVLDLSGLDEIGEVDVTNRTVVVGPGVRLSDLEEHLKPYGLAGGHYPQSFHLASVAGSISMRGSGTFSSLYGNVEDRVGDLEVVLADGTIVQTKSMPRASTGPDLKQLFVGAEGTLGIITKVLWRLVPIPEQRLFQAFRFPSFADAAAVARQLLIDGIRPAVLRIYDPTEAAAKHAGFAGEDGWVMILVFDGAKDLTDVQLATAKRLGAEHNAVDLGPEPAVDWEVKRFNWSWSTDKDVKGGIAEAIEITVNWSDLPAVYEHLKAKVTEEFGEFMAHVSHVYDQGAALYTIVRADLPTDEEAIEAYNKVFKLVTEEALASGARIAHHHGVGIERAPWMAAELGEGLNLFRRIKKALDPNGILNPGKMGL